MPYRQFAKKVYSQSWLMEKRVVEEQERARMNSSGRIVRLGMLCSLAQQTLMVAVHGRAVLTATTTLMLSLVLYLLLVLVRQLAHIHCMDIQTHHTIRSTHLCSSELADLAQIIMAVATLRFVSACCSYRLCK